MPRQRTARSAVLGVRARRPNTSRFGLRAAASTRRRIVVAVLIVLALLLITTTFRADQTGPLGPVHDATASALRPFEIAAERVARPFRDAWNWFEDMTTARDDAERLRKENERLRQQVIANQLAANDIGALKALLRYREGPRFPEDYDGIASAVIGRPGGPASDAVVLAVGASDGVEVNAPVVTADGLVGIVTRVSGKQSRVSLLTNSESNVSALDVRRNAAGIVRHGRGVGSTLVLDRVRKELDVREGDWIVTAGSSSRLYPSLYPRGIPIGEVTSVGQADTDLYKQVQVEPFADLSSLSAVLVLVHKPGAGS